MCFGAVRHSFEEGVYNLLKLYAKQTKCFRPHMRNWRLRIGQNNARVWNADHSLNGHSISKLYAETLSGLFFLPIFVCFYMETDICRSSCVQKWKWHGPWMLSIGKLQAPHCNAQVIDRIVWARVVGCMAKYCVPHQIIKLHSATQHYQTSVSFLFFLFVCVCMHDYNPLAGIIRKYAMAVMNIFHL